MTAKTPRLIIDESLIANSVGQALSWDNVNKKINVNVDGSTITVNASNQLQVGTINRSKVSDFWATPFWTNIPDKPFNGLGSEFTTDASNNLVVASIDFSKIANRNLSLITIDTNLVMNGYTISINDDTNRPSLSLGRSSGGIRWVIFKRTSTEGVPDELVFSFYDGTSWTELVRFDAINKLVSIGGSGKLKISGNEILDGNSNVVLSFDGAGNVSVGGSLRVVNNEIYDNGFVKRITLGDPTYFYGNLRMEKNKPMFQLNNTGTALRWGIQWLSAGVGTMEIHYYETDDALVVWDIQNSAELVKFYNISGKLWVKDGIQLGNDVIYHSGGVGVISFNPTTNRTTLAGDLQINGNDIIDSGGNVRIQLGSPLYFLASVRVSGYSVMVYNDSGRPSFQLRRNATGIGWSIFKRTSSEGVPDELVFTFYNGTSWTEYVKIDPNNAEFKIPAMTIDAKSLQFKVLENRTEKTVYNSGSSFDVSTLAYQTYIDYDGSNTKLQKVRIIFSAKCVNGRGWKVELKDSSGNVLYSISGSNTTYQKKDSGWVSFASTTTELFVYLHALSDLSGPETAYIKNCRIYVK